MVLFFIILLIINILFNLTNLMNCVYDSLFVWFYNVYPSIFIFYNISNYLLYNNLIKKISKVLKIVVKFDSDKSYTILLINIFLGNPGTMKLINNYYENKEISDRDYLLLCDICFFMNPLFILSIINLKYYLIYILCSFIYIKLYCLCFDYKNIDRSYYQINFEKYSSNILFKSINDVIFILLNVACFITFFNIFKNTLLFCLSMVNINYEFINIILSFLEVASGLKCFKYNNVDFIIFILLINFQGICILMQSFSILNKKNISFLRYILKNLINSIIRTLIFYFIITLFHI